MSRALLLLAVLAHAKGFHKRDVLTVSARTVEALVALDIDSGKRCQLLRAVADANGDGALSSEELSKLKAQLVALALRPLKVEISGYPLTWAEGESKLDVRGDRRASDVGLSVAVLVRSELPRPVSPGMTLELADESPDQSHIVVEIYQATEVDARAEAPIREELRPGEKVKARLGRLSGR